MIFLLNILILAFCSVHCRHVQNHTEILEKLVEKHLLHKNSQKNLEKLENLADDELAEEFSGQFEGDMIISQDQLRDMESARRIGIRDDKYRWIDRKIPYTIDTSFFDEYQTDLIYDAMFKIEDVSCLKFVPYKSNQHDDYIKVIGEEDGCFSQVGRQGGVQAVNLSPDGCFRVYTIVHEFLHALGFFHMQSASNRDEFIKVVFENIDPSVRENFNTHSVQTLNDFDIPYDYDSVLHYSEYSFAVDRNKPSMIPLKPLGDARLGQRSRLSEGDIQRINKMYCE